MRKRLICNCLKVVKETESNEAHSSLLMLCFEEIISSRPSTSM